MVPSLISDLIDIMLCPQSVFKFTLKVFSLFANSLLIQSLMHESFIFIDFLCRLHRAIIYLIFIESFFAIYSALLRWFCKFNQLWSDWYLRYLQPAPKVNLPHPHQNLHLSNLVLKLPIMCLGIGNTIVFWWWR